MAWTIEQSIDQAYHVNNLLGDELIIVKLDCISDASGTDTDLEAAIIQKIMGGWLYEIKVVPGSGADEPTAAWDIDIEDEDNGHIAEANGNSTTVPTYTDGSLTIGHYPIIEKTCSFVSATLGDENTAVVYIKVLK